MAAHYGVAVIPARVGRPRDKAKVEVGVQVVERWILAALRNRTFFSVDEVNAAIRELLEKLNQRRFKKLDTSRKELFESLERPALRPLPERPYQFAHWKRARVNPDYHIEVEGHYYSVPYQLIGKTVEARIGRGQVEIFYRGRRVAAHLRSRKKGGHSTCEAHMPEKHRFYRESFRDLEKKAELIGAHVVRLARAIMESKRHPVQGYRAVMGIIRLARVWSRERVDAACARALSIGAYSYRSVRSILEKGLDQVPLHTESPALSLEHENIRGGDYYRKGGRRC
jgi:transposase